MIDWSPYPHFTGEETKACSGEVAYYRVRTPWSVEPLTLQSSKTEGLFTYALSGDV